MREYSTNYKRKPTKVLFIEPDDACWATIEQVVQQCLTTATALRLASLPQALSQFAEWENEEWDLPHLIFMELYLPQLEDGWSLLEHLKAMSNGIRQIPLIILSKSSMEETICNAYQLGASAYVVKPNEYHQWLDHFKKIQTYWWETASFSPLRF